ncbi:MAG: SHOCT domain-containing protein [Gemmatimonadales bacterium]|nr:SHOCT domain-containing protein [Gemmatimonadales bacterium]
MGIFDQPGPNGLTSLWSEGDHPFEAKEQQRVSATLATGETVHRWVRGRTDGKRTLWLATERRIVVLRVGGFFPRSSELAVADVRALEMQEGAHGHTVRLTTTTTRVSLLAVHPPMSVAFAEHLKGAAGIEPVLIPSRRATPGRDAQAEAYAAAEAERRARYEANRRAVFEATQAAVAAPAAPAAAAAGGDLLQRLKEAAALREAGVLTDDEFAALKARLLAG